jgi:hypothetical protein
VDVTFPSSVPGVPQEGAGSLAGRLFVWPAGTSVPCGSAHFVPAGNRELDNSALKTVTGSDDVLLSWISMICLP